jgi:hypothetical protein
MLLADASDGTVDTDLDQVPETEQAVERSKKKIMRHNGPGDHPDFSEVASEGMDPKRIQPVNAVRDKAQLEKIKTSLQKDGWKGPPVLAIDDANGTKALTGSHRILAAREVTNEDGDAIDIPVHKLSYDDLSAEVDGVTLSDALSGGVRDEDVAGILKTYAKEHSQLADAAKIMQYEIDSQTER